MSDTEMWALENGAILYNVHPMERCAGAPCWIHHPTNHHMLAWQMVRRRTPEGDWLYRECLHGVLHLDPDERWFLEHIQHIDTSHSHSCDGCCEPPKERET